ncbi:hypothetical protein GOP47_0029521 [Adiantum capillus-veneris]|nr:hypothetical protein GOP47_0029521 [Adiantum capillus-veneris]
MIEDCGLPVFTGEEDAEDWICDLELYMMSLQMLTNKAKLRGLSQVMQGKAKAWLNNLEVANRQSWSRVRASFVRDFKTKVSKTQLDGRFDQEVCRKSILDKEVSCDAALTGSATTKMLGVIQAPVLWRILWLMKKIGKPCLTLPTMQKCKIEDLVDRSDFLSTSSSSEGEVEVCQDALSM